LCKPLKPSEKSHEWATIASPSSVS
jgi:hypothetical protein